MSFALAMPADDSSDLPRSADTSPQILLPLDAPRPGPAHDRFPANHLGTAIRPLLLADLLASGDPLMVVGYASLEGIVDFLGECFSRLRDGRMERVRILIGNEPFPPRRANRRGRSVELPREIADYWLEQRISVSLCADVIAAREALADERVHIRSAGRKPIHAKIYVGNSGVTLGSSNFTPAGLRTQIEGNARWTETEAERQSDARELSETIWALGTDYRAGLDELLQRLLREVTWEEALARACAEILEGEWAHRYMDLLAASPEVQLWPSQEQGIAQALWVLETSGSVLIADATGSGKTRTGTSLLRAIQIIQWHSGNTQADFPVLVCPPHVADLWRREAIAAGRALHVCSHGVLSRGKGKRHADALRALRRADLLAVDEAHNFFNRNTERTSRLFTHGADHVVLFTATPINRGKQDLISVVDLLGADNMEDEVVKRVESLGRRWRRTGREPSDAEFAPVKKALQRFIVRRTKGELNRLIEREPERYRNALDGPCRFPMQHSRTYSTGETARDRELASEIRNEAAKLRGVILLRQPLRVSPDQRQRGITDEQYLESRLNAARALAAYHVRASLRSSRAALHEHLHGTAEAAKKFGISQPGKGRTTGNVIQTIEEIRGVPPKFRLAIEAPDWLRDATAHFDVCNHEIASYVRIGQLLDAISAGREEAKASHVASLLDGHGLVLAFDRSLLTLEVLRNHLHAVSDAEIILATGRAGREKLADAMALGSDARRVIGLCSDAMAEGMNLQAASAVVHLDLPSVIRIAEQRIGRVDRMDSPHPDIEVWWPDDSPEFALRSDERLVERHFEVKTLLGANIRLPAKFEPLAEDSKTIRASDVMAELENRVLRREKAWEGLPDALEPVRSLVYGPDALLTPAVYAGTRGSKARFEVAVSVVEGDGEGWVFMAIEAGGRGAPKWVFVPGSDDALITTLEDVSAALRGRLGRNPANLRFDTAAAERWRDGLNRVARAEDLLLPRRKQTAVKEMRHVLERYRRTALRTGDSRRREVVEEVLATVQPRRSESPNLEVIADWWLEVIRTRWLNHVARRRSKPARLRDLRSTLQEDPIDTNSLAAGAHLELDARPLEKRVVVAIIGVPGTAAAGSE